MNLGSSETDLRHAISLRPSVFSHAVQQDVLPHREIHRSDDENSVQIVTDNSKDDKKSEKEGHSTAFEPTTPTGDGQADPISRHVERHSGINTDVDVESQRLPAYTRENDPFQLSSKIKSREEISLIRANSSRKRNDGRGDGNSDGAGSINNHIPTNNIIIGGGSNNNNNNNNDSDSHNRVRRAGRALCSPAFLMSGKHGLRTRRLQGFYENQNENIERLLKPVDDHRREAKDQHGDNELRYKIAVRGSFIANVCLAGLQVYAAAASGSLSLFTTMIDALFDPMSNVTLILANRAVNRVDPRRFPSGKARIETAGNIVFCFLMTSVSIVIIVQSIRNLVAGSDTLTTPFHLPSIIAVCIAFTTKLCLFLYCYAIRNVYSQVRILWEDHRNDLIINFFGLFFSLLGSKIRWWIDPMGAILLSCLIVFLWLRTAYSEFQLLIGVTADTNTLQLITYISMTHSPDIKAIDTVRAYYSGPRLIVEVDVVMDPEDSLRHTHDTAEDLQQKLERLPAVERAYVHVDFETSHAPEHFLKKEL